MNSRPLVRVGRIVRRGVSLGLIAASLWVAVRAVALTDSAAAVDALSHDARLAVSLLRLELPASGSSAPLWERPLLAQSPLLRAAAASPAPAPAEPDLPDSSEGEDAPAPDLADSGDGGKVVRRTMGPSPSRTYLQAGDVYVFDRAGKNAPVAALASAPVRLDLPDDGPQILILHTHTTEAYTPSEGETYVPSDPYRTTDCNHNVVRVGEEMAQVFRDRGYGVVHDTALYDYPSYNGAYARSGAAAERWLARYPTIRVVLDVHRDALEGEDGTIYKAVSAPADGGTAQVMLVVGTDGTGAKHPLWQENLTFAMRLQKQMLADRGTLARPIVLRASNFNQQLSVGSLLVEVGTHGNTLPEAIAGARLFAESACAVLDDLRP